MTLDRMQDWSPIQSGSSHNSQLRRRLLAATACVFALCAGVGCDVPIDAFEENRLFAKRLELNEGVELTSVRSDVDSILIELFGTPDQPRWPAYLQSDNPAKDLLSLERLQRAAGAVRSDENDVHYGLYREHCILCHGIAGNGLGATSRLLNPYPRDFRMGKFKFKSTPQGSRPTRDDLRQLLRRGIAGTSMPDFALLPDDDLEALIDYVIYLSIRGEVERGLLMRATYELDLEAGERLVDPTRDPTSTDIDVPDQHSVVELVSNAANKWLKAELIPAAENPAAENPAEHNSLNTPLPPAELPLFGADLASDAERERLAQSIAHGRELFQGQVANCSSCHGPLGAGDGTVNDFDDWTKDWTTQAGLDPLDKQQLRPMLALGALKPRHILPRNLQNGIYRGGSRPEDLYVRIVRGIEGTPMPAVPMQPENALGLTEADAWDLVNFVLSLPEHSDREANQ